MQASNDNSATALLWVKIGYIAFVALIALIAYRLGSVWFGNIMVILLTFPMTWFVEPKTRRVARFLHLFLSLALLLATVSILFLTAREQAEAIARSKILGFLIGGDAAKVLVSIIGAFIMSAIILLGPIMIVAYISTEWMLALRETYGVTRGEALRLLISMVFNTSYPYYIVENGEITQTKPKGLLPMFGGPGLVVVKPYNAVVFERGGNITRIEGPGKVMTRHMEFAKGVIDLRKQWSNFTAENVLTQDHVPLIFHSGVGFRIESRLETAKRAEKSQSFEGGRFTGIIGGDYPVYKRTIYRAVYNTTAAGWKTLTQGAAETQLRRVLREKYSLENLYRLQDGELIPDKSVIDEIRLEAQRRLQAISITWGTTITGLNIKSFEAPEDVKDRLLEMWAQRYASRAQLLGARGSRDAALTKLEADEATIIQTAGAERIASLTRLEADRRAIVDKADAERKAIEAKATAESYAIRKRGRAKSSVEAGLITAKARASKQASQMEAEGERDAAVLKAQARAVEGQGERDYIIEIGRGEAEARAELYRRILGALYPGGVPLKEETIDNIVQQLSARVGTEDAIRFLGAIASGGRRWLPSPEGALDTTAASRGTQAEERSAPSNSASFQGESDED